MGPSLTGAQDQSARAGSNISQERASAQQTPTAASKSVNGHGSKPGLFHTYPSHVPLSQRRAVPLNLNTVERPGRIKSQSATPRDRPHQLREAPTFRPTVEEFRDPFEYIQQIRAEAERYGICKIIPPASWKPDFAVDTERFFFKTRRQELNSVEGSTRTGLQYVDQLVKYHKQNGTNLSRFPSVDKRPLNLYRLKKAVQARGGYEKVCKVKKWAEIGRDLGYSGKIMSSLSTSLKNSYQKWIQPYEEYLKVAKSGLQQHMNLDSRQSPNGSKTHNDFPDPASFSTHGKGNASDQQNGIQPQNGFQTESHAAAPNGSQPGEFPYRKDSLLNGEQIQDDSPGGSTRPSTSAKSLKNENGENYVNDLKRSHGDSGVSTDVDDEAGDSEERRSKRLKKTPTVAGSQINQARPSWLDSSDLPQGEQNGGACGNCGTNDDRSALISCDGCESVYHKDCLDDPSKINPQVEWNCPRCLVGTGEFGFEEGGIYSLRQFQEKADQFRENHFELRMESGAQSRGKRHISEEEVEREFWRLVESPSDEVEVEYGADIHSNIHGSGFPTIEKDPFNLYASSYWNLNNLPFHPDSLFKHIKSDISGMTNPWLYVGMCFSTFCWHNEDHYCYSANYQHFGATKTWYGIPGADAKRFEDAMRTAVPELFESQPDLLFQLVTLLPPDRLTQAGVNVYALDQRAGQFVITFPQAYHAGFNHGFNFNEAVNFAPDDWESFGEAGVERLQEFHKQPCFSHDELLLTAAQRDTTIKTAIWLGPALRRSQKREIQQRRNFLDQHQQKAGQHQCKLAAETELENACSLRFEVLQEDFPEIEYVCSFCKTYSYLSSFRCLQSGVVLCLDHVAAHPCCDMEMNDRYYEEHLVRYRVTDNELESICQKVEEKAHLPVAWQEKLTHAIEEDDRPLLRTLQSLVNEGERIPWQLPGLDDLKSYVNQCNDWVEEAQYYITRKQQNRRKNEKAWRKGRSAKADEAEEKEKELRDVRNITSLLQKADALCFDCPQIAALEERAQAVKDFQDKARRVLADPNKYSALEMEELTETGKSFNVDLPELDGLEGFMKKQVWVSEAQATMQAGQPKFRTLQEVKDFIARGVEAGIPSIDPNMSSMIELKIRALNWEIRCQETLRNEVQNAAHLEVLATQAQGLPVTEESLAKIDALLSKQREAHKLIKGYLEKTKEPLLRNRPMYKEAREACDRLGDMTCKPMQLSEVEAALKKQENWMRKGKKLFGKANAPLHILQQHLDYVVEHNGYCFDLTDKPRMPVEPASRENSPAQAEELEGLKSEKNVFCMCRQAEAGTMLECERCLEWYHSKCLRIARGKVKEDDKYLCPICDYRVKIPRDAARPKLEELVAWQDEIPDLPFQPEEEAALEEIIQNAQSFREFLRPHVNPVLTSSEELTTQRFYLRKLEGAEVLLTLETNFFRQELHRWAPVAAEPPPILEQSLSTRKPRPTKQQRLMQQHGVQNPDELPPELRTKAFNVPKAQRNSEQKIQPAPSKELAPSQPNSFDANTDRRVSGSGLPGADAQPKITLYPPPVAVEAQHDPAMGAFPYYSQNPSQAGQTPYQTNHNSIEAAQAALNNDLFRPGNDNPFEHAKAAALDTDLHDAGIPASPSPHPPEPADDQMFNEFVSHPEDEVEQAGEAPRDA